eukprot:362583-Chlamydomonas_euryale.AAC.2
MWAHTQPMWAHIQQSHEALGVDRIATPMPNTPALSWNGCACHTHVWHTCSNWEHAGNTHARHAHARHTRSHHTNREHAGNTHARHAHARHTHAGNANACSSQLLPAPRIAQVLRYGPTNKYGAHMDGLGRVMSVLIYLIREISALPVYHL